MPQLRLEARLMNVHTIRIWRNEEVDFKDIPMVDASEEAIALMREWIDLQDYIEFTYQQSIRNAAQDENEGELPWC